MPDDLAALAVFSAYEWWLVADRHFLELTGVLTLDGGHGEGPGALDVDALRTIARTYSVSRNIPRDAADSQATNIVRAFMADETRTALKKPFKQRANDLASIAAKTAVTIAPRNGQSDGQPRILASAFSKLAWFVAPNDWTIFDRYVGAAVLRREGTGIAQMKAFYAALAPCWDDVTSALIPACEEAGVDRLLAYRIVDKYLFLHGIGSYRPAGPSGRDTLKRHATLADKLASRAVSAERRRLGTFAAALPHDLTARLRKLGDVVASPLRAANWTKDSC